MTILGLRNHIHGIIFTPRQEQNTLLYMLVPVVIQLLPVQ
ncbi:hypothetical protein ERICIV_03141 [Paenibacillus larvae subsp. larvae]|uniref:Uncharacterized protein n=1 Tax=Paenibacillus larvae subsp. larvae TaxID=147375 RepID=A0A2L1UGH5_9BACL|nr:hypothetical protein ERICIII_03238 [Paenibacillus larvae subsp. larvae]AVF32020.1 hypothetical protein ERICIV_03141 [Paenibacillus larvae subsp. larvae]